METHLLSDRLLLYSVKIEDIGLGIDLSICEAFGHKFWHVLAFFPDNVTTVSPEEERRRKRHKDLIEETVAVGMMFASKAFVQLLANPIVGPLTHK